VDALRLYQVANWDENFENFKSRSINECSFVCVPNKQHGLSFMRLMALADGTTVYGVWHLIIGACSRQRLPREGWLTDTGRRDGVPWSTEDMALRWHRPVSEIQRALGVLSSPQIGWIQEFTRDGDTLVSARYPRGMHIIEGNERKEGNEQGAGFTRVREDGPPTLQEWLTNANFIGYDPTEATTAWHGLEAVAWQPKGQRVRDWRKLQVVYRDRHRERQHMAKERKAKPESREIKETFEPKSL